MWAARSVREGAVILRGLCREIPRTGKSRTALPSIEKAGRDKKMGFLGINRKSQGYLVSH